MKRLILRCALLVLPSLLLAGPARADAVGPCTGTLAQIIAAGSCIAGNVVISNITYAVTATSSGGGTVNPPPTANDVTVSVSTSSFHGQISGDAAELIFAAQWLPGNGTYDIALNYTVAPLNGNLFGILLTVDTAFTGGGAIGAVVDLFDDGVGVLQGCAQTHPCSDGFETFFCYPANCDNGGPGPFTQQVHILFSDTDMTAINIGYGTVNAPITPIPEPSTFALLATGVLFIRRCAARKRC